MSKKSEFPIIDLSGVDRAKATPIPFKDIITGGYFMECNETNQNIYQKCQKFSDDEPVMKMVVRMGHQSCWSTKEMRWADDMSPVIPLKVHIKCST